MTDNPVHLSSHGPGYTVLPPLPYELVEGLAASPDVRALETLVARFPAWPAAWAALGAATESTVHRYAAYRVGYHRGLDALRANGWRGSGYVRWSDATNTGFLRCLVGLGRCAAEIGEVEEAERVRQFLAQLDPLGVPEGE